MRKKKKQRPELLTPNQVAVKLNFHVRTIYRWANKGLIESIPFGNDIRFNAAQINRIKRQGLPKPLSHNNINSSISRLVGKKNGRYVWEK